MIHKVKQLDLFIKVVDSTYNKYIIADYQYHADYSTYTLRFGFEDWTNIKNDGKQHIYVTAEYVNANGSCLVKFQDEDWSKLCDCVKKWNDAHRVDTAGCVPTEELDYDEDVLFKDLHDLWINGVLNLIRKLKNFFKK